MELEAKYRNYIDGIDGVTIAKLGIGSPTTWHGETEIRIRGCDFITTSAHLEENCGDSDTEDNDSSTISGDFSQATP